VFRSEYEVKPALRLAFEPCFGFPGDVSGVVVKYHLDRRVGRIGGVEFLELADELARPMTVLDAGVHLTGQQVDAGQLAQTAMTLILVVARKRRGAIAVAAADRARSCRSPGCRASRHRR